MTATRLATGLLVVTTAAALALLQSSAPHHQVAAGLPPPPPEALPGFFFQDPVLFVRTRALTFAVAGARITYLRDETSGEVYAGDSPDESLSNARPVAFASVRKTGGVVYRTVDPRAAALFERIDDRHAAVSYLVSQASGAALRLEISIEPDLREVTLRVVAQEKNSAFAPAWMEAPAFDTRSAAVILGSGARYLRSEPDADDRTSDESTGHNAPSVAVIEGLSTAAAVWTESSSSAPDWFHLNHSPGADHIILHTAADPKQADPRTIESPVLRLSVHRNWLDAARRWRALFEQRTGARPLWENRSLWVRSIHAVFNATNNSYSPDRRKFAELAAAADPSRILYLLWNGDRIVLFGDHTLIRTAPRPAPGELPLLAEHGWPLLLYHPYLLIYTEAGEQRRLAFLKSHGWLPPFYTFAPDLPAGVSGWHAYWSPVRTDYFDGSEFYLLHPAAPPAQEYLLHNLSSYADLHRASGLYLDTLGADASAMFPAGLTLIANRDFLAGEVDLLARIALMHSQLALMSEYQPLRIVPFAFYSWEGPATRHAQQELAPCRLNHPLRTALLGSYMWTREDNESEPDGVASALMGALPQVSLAGDYRVSLARAQWSQQRAQLFCDAGLFNDLPDVWSEDALAYYRGFENRWFVFKKIGASYGYVEILDDGTEAVRLVEQ